MRAYVPDYRFEAPSTLEQALVRMSDTSVRWRPMAGGTDLMVLYEAGKLPVGNYLDLSRISELSKIEVTPHFVHIGATVTYTDIRNNSVLQAEFPALCEAAAMTGSIAIQNRGTLGGNIMNGSPAADSPPVLMVLNTELDLISTSGARTVRYVDFHTGYKSNLAQPNELLRSIRLSRTHRPKFVYFRKVGTRKAQAISKLCFCGAVYPAELGSHRIRIALGSVAPTVIRCSATENALRGFNGDPEQMMSARSTLERELTPITDIRSTDEYRRTVAGNILVEFLRQSGVH